jgi:RNA polymerase sigma-70 factor (ECF subfamily)
MEKLGMSASVEPTPGVGGAAASSERLLRAFNELRDELVSTLWFLLGNPDDAQDAVQDVFLKCWRTQETLGEVRDLRAWIFRVTLNVARDVQRSAWHRRTRQLSGGETMLQSKDPTPAQALEKREAKERLRQAIFHLRPEEKEVFLLRQNANLTYEEIAQIRHSPLGTVKTQMRSALQKLREQLGSGPPS